MRLIDADRLNKPIYAEEDNITGSGMSYDEICGYNDGIDIAWNKIDQAPTIDAVPVVRCYECKHWKKDVEGCTEIVGRCDYANYMIGANGYCLYGEREENG